MNIKRTQKIEVRCSFIEKSIIKNKAEKAGITISAYLRKSGLEQKVHGKFSEEELEVYKNLHTFHSNFSKITNLLRDKDSGFAKEIINTMNLIRYHLNKLQ